MLPLISVVVPTYNQDEVFGETIKSVLNQTYKNIELIIVDDGSEKDITPLINRFDDTRISFYKLEHSNANVARNYGIEKSKGEYIAMLDSDDLWLEDHLEDCLSTLQQTEAAGLYGSLILRHKLGEDRTVKVRELKEDELMINYLLTTGYGAQTSTLFMTAASAKTVLWDPELKRHQDYDFVVRYSKQYKMMAKEKPTAIYSVGGSSVNIDLNSCIRFIRNNEDDIDPPLYNSYNLNMLKLAEQLNASPEIILHYRKEATRCKEYLSYDSYLTTRLPNGRWETLKCKFAYLFHILRIGVE